MLLCNKQKFRKLDKQKKQLSLFKIKYAYNWKKSVSFIPKLDTNTCSQLMFAHINYKKEE